MLIYFNQRFRKYLGTTLLELMLAMTLGLAIVSMLLEVYLVSKRNDQLQMALIRIQDNANRAISIMNAALQKAGHIGCSRLTKTFLVTAYPPYSITSTNKLIGKNNEFTVRYAEISGDNLIAMHDPSILYTTTKIHFSPGDILMIADCTQAEIFQAADVFVSKSQQKIISSHPLRHPFTPHAEISRLKINNYFIAKTMRTNTDGTPIYSLFMEDIHRRKAELVENLTQMKLLYSIKQNGKLMDVSADNIADWSQVVGVSMAFNLVSEKIKKTWYAYIALSGEK